MGGLAGALRISAGRAVIDKTGLPGSYRIAINYDMMGARRPPSGDPPIESAPSVLTAVQEQLGLKLEPSKARRNVLVIDRLRASNADRMNAGDGLCRELLNTARTGTTTRDAMRSSRLIWRGVRT